MNDMSTSPTSTATAAAAIAELESQGTLAPGTQGWWKVWGAGVGHVRPGDIILSKLADRERGHRLHQ